MISLSLIEEFSPPGATVIDVGGGSSLLADRLLECGRSVAVLDIAPAAIDRAKHRLGERASLVRWIVGDVTAIAGVGSFDLWHDRAAFHFLTDPKDRQAYIRLMSNTVPAGGHVIIATFAPEGPKQCSGLDVVRYDAASLQKTLGPGLTLLKTVPEIHFTPWGKPQPFQYSAFVKA